MAWEPTLGDTVRVATSDRVGVVVHITLTEWGFLYDVEHGEPAGTSGEPAGPRRERRTYATGQLVPIGDRAE